MTGDELAVSIKAFGLSNPEFARLVRVSARAVQQWINGERSVPGPAEAFVDLFASVPEAMRAAAIARLRRENDAMLNGFYSMQFAGNVGQGGGMLVFDRGSICGADLGGAIYDGKYGPRGDGNLDVDVTVTVPPGVPLVTGVPAQPQTYAFQIVTVIPASGEGEVQVNTPFGPVNVIFKRVRDLPKAAA